ncbi:MAG TPA: hypothetical protein VM537_20910 [Anaerolineae bacterium]|nr:hypothetical protein [Anaerolineae bacterium]
MQRILIVLLLGLTAGCASLSAETAPPELRRVPSSQAALLTTLIDIVEAECPAFDGERGSKADLIRFLELDREAWRKMADFYNPKEADSE